MEYSKQISKRGRVGGSSGRISAVYFLLGLLLIAGLTSILHHFYFTPATDTDNSSKEYAELLRKAKLLTAKYSELTGGGLSQDLAKVESTHSSTSSTVDTNDILSMKGTKDMIIGMAQDTDPKNFVRLTVFVSKPWCSLAVTANCSMYRLCSASRCGGKRTFKLNYNAPLDTNWGCASVSDADAVIFVNKPIPDRHAQIATELKITREWWLASIEIGDNFNYQLNLRLH